MKEAILSQFCQVIKFCSTAKIEANFKISSLKKIDATFNPASRQNGLKPDQVNFN